MATYKTLAIVDDVNTCDCCGKSNLKSTVAMQRDDGEVAYFGSVCASRHSGRDSKTINREAADVLANKKAAAKKEFERSAEYLGEQLRIAKANSERVEPGKPFREFCRAACDTAAEKKREIAAMHGVAIYSF